jgi:hypothetical protein
MLQRRDYMKKERLKTFTTGVLCGALIFGSVNAFATGFTAELADFKVLVNGKVFQSQQPPLVINDSTYLPLRAVGDALGVAVNWNSNLNQVEIGSTPAATVSEVANYSRNNPAPINTVQNISVTNFSGNYNANLRITETIRGNKAWELIKATNQFNSAPKEGYEYVLAKVAVSVMSVDNDKAVDLNSYNFQCFSGNNEESPRASVVVPSPAFTSKLYTGGNAEGYIALQVKKDDQDPKIVYGLKYDGSGGIWFSIK